MKKSIFLAVAAVAMTACSNDVDLGMKDANKQTADNAIGFEVRNSNMSRADTHSLEATGHYNFGVWAYKDIDHTNAIMANYLVGYFGNNVGYSKDGTTNSTHGTSGNMTDHLSLWGYEGLGNTEYNWTTNTDSQSYYKKSDTYYMSNKANQYLRYFDFSSNNTEFFAYAPYLNGNTATFDISSKKISFPDGSIKAGYNDKSQFEYLCAYADIAKAKYGEDVPLEFKHLNSRIKIVFYEDIAGYQVTMKNLSTGVGIIAVPATLSSSTYSYADNKLVKEAKAVATLGSTITFDTPTATAWYTGTEGEAIDNATIRNKALVFSSPIATYLKDNKIDALADNDSYSSDIYYGIPHDSSCGLTFRVSFQLTSTTNETINVYNAGVHVPAANCVWTAGRSYTYVFKITKKTTGNTGTDSPTLNPDPGTGALFPIVFDGITVEDWKDATENAEGNDHNIN